MESYIAAATRQPKTTQNYAIKHPENGMLRRIMLYRFSPDRAGL
jgi:hypothetical protein